MTLKHNINLINWSNVDVFGLLWLFIPRGLLGTVWSICRIGASISSYNIIPCFEFDFPLVVTF